MRDRISPEREFPLLWLVGTDLPDAVIAEDSEGQPLPPQEKSETREENEEEVLRFSLAGGSYSELIRAIGPLFRRMFLRLRMKLQEGGCGVAGTYRDFAWVRSLCDAE
jgi:hypothetical protein